MIFSDCIQNSEKWIAEKLGKPSASNCSKIITNDGKPSKSQAGYMYELAAEAITGKRADDFTSVNMQVGHDREDESRQLYQFMNGVIVDRVGIVYKDEEKKFLCSPDGIINGEYGLELKNVLPKTQVKYLIDGELPSEYFGQVQFSLFVTGFKFWDFCSHSPALKPLIIRVYPDKEFHAALEAELKSFCKKLEETINRIK